jgi:hypothetical protein
MFFRRNYIKNLTAELRMTKAELLGRIGESHPEKRFKDLFVVADEEDRYVAIATYEVEYMYRGHPPSLAYAIYKADSRVVEIDHTGYGLGIK